MRMNRISATALIGAMALMGAGAVSAAPEPEPRRDPPEPERKPTPARRFPLATSCDRERVARAEQKRARKAAKLVPNPHPEDAGTSGKRGG